MKELTFESPYNENVDISGLNLSELKDNPAISWENNDPIVVKYFVFPGCKHLEYEKKYHPRFKRVPLGDIALMWRRSNSNCQYCHNKSYGIRKTLACLSSSIGGLSGNGCAAYEETVISVAVPVAELEGRNE